MRKLRITKLFKHLSLSIANCLEGEELELLISMMQMMMKKFLIARTV
jgi:hypothetical protein